MKDVLIFRFKIIEMVRCVRCETRAKQFELFTVERITEQTDVYVSSSGDRVRYKQNIASQLYIIALY